MRPNAARVYTDRHGGQAPRRRSTRPGSSWISRSSKPVHGKQLVYLDSAASSQKPRAVIDTIVDVYETSYAAVHRAVYALGEAATERYEARP